MNLNVIIARGGVCQGEADTAARLSGRPALATRIAVTLGCIGVPADVDGTTVQL